MSSMAYCHSGYRFLFRSCFYNSFAYLGFSVLCFLSPVGREMKGVCRKCFYQPAYRKNDYICINERV